MTRRSDSLPADALRPGRVDRLGGWAVGTGPAGSFAVSRRCRHQLADLSRGSVDARGCLVCPWHGSRYDVRSGRMVRGPRGFLGYSGPTPGYATVVRWAGRLLPLRVGRVRRERDRVFVDPPA